MKNDRFAVVAIVLILWFAVDGKKAGPEFSPSPDDGPGISTGFLSDVRVRLSPAAMSTLSEFIRTGKLSKDRIGIDMTKVEAIRCLPNRLIFDPPIELDYDGPGPLNASTVVKEIGIQSDGTILVDVVNSPIDLIFE